MRLLLLIISLALPLGTVAQLAPYTLVFLHKKDDADKLAKEAIDQLMKGHLANIERLAKEGKLLVAGPFDGGGGIFILNTTSLAEAHDWLSTDPGIQANRWNIEMQPFTPRVGSVCAAKEPYEMVTYQFIRFEVLVTKFTAQTYPQILNKHDDYLKTIVATGNVIAEGVFGDREGGILLIKGELQQEVIELDPGVQEGLISVVIKKLWVAKGSFCEQ